MLESYNGGALFGNSHGAIVQEIKLLGLDANIKDNVKKARKLARGKYLANTFLLIPDRRRYRGMILDLNND